jgi:hypothetical protein
MSEKLGIPYFSFLKELLLILLVLVLALRRRELKWGYYDSIIAIYIALLVGITLFTTGIRGLIYGGRYDFAFFIAFLVAYHGRYLLMKQPSYYIRLFLYSGGLMLVMSFLLKWPLSEDILLHLGYSGNPSSWQFG